MSLNCLKTRYFICLSSVAVGKKAVKFNRYHGELRKSYSIQQLIQLTSILLGRFLCTLFPTAEVFHVCKSI